MSQEEIVPAETISDSFIQAVCLRLAQDKPVREKLPLDGYLNIERPLPFLCVYRQPPRGQDEGTSRLVTGEASYLIASGHRRFKQGLSKLVHRIAESLGERFEAFLIIELWSALENQFDNGLGWSAPTPRFRLIASKARPPTEAIEALEKGLWGIQILKHKATVEIDYSRKRSPQRLLPLIPAVEAQKLNCFILGLEVNPIYRHAQSGEIFPEVLRKLHRGVAQSLKQAFFGFSHNQTSYRPVNYHALGRRAVVKAVWNVARGLAEISNAFDVLLQVTPVNIETAWVEFRRRHFERAPVLFYRPLPVDPALLKRRLYKIPLERVEDPTLTFLFQEKRIELDRQLTMLGDRGTRKFLYGSLQLFGGVSDDLVNLAENLLKKISPRSRDDSPGGYLKATAFAERARTEIDYYQKLYPPMSAKVEVRDDTVGLMVSQGNLLIGQKTKIPTSRVEALLQHEVGTHVLTYFNGRSQPFQQLYIGMAGYEELQEGLAVLAEYLVGGLSRPRLRLLAGRVIATRLLIEGATFIDTFRQLNQSYGFTQRTAFTITVRIYRSGGLTKDAVYLRGLVGVLKYIKNGGELEPLFAGKITAEYIPIIRELQWRQVLRAAPLRPRYMDLPQTTKRLAYLRNGVSVLDLIERRRR